MSVNLELSELVQAAGRLAAVRLAEQGGRPLSPACLRLCAAEALLLAEEVNSMRKGSGLKEAWEQRHAAARAEWDAEQLERATPDAPAAAPRHRF